MATIYREQKRKNYTNKLKKVTNKIPRYAKSFIDSRSDNMEIRSRYEYARDIYTFLHYIKETDKNLKGTPLKEIPLDKIENITLQGFDEYSGYLSSYLTPTGHEVENNECGKRRKLAVVKSFYRYLHIRGMIEKNPADLIEMPKLHKKGIIILDDVQEAELVSHVESGGLMSHKEKEFYEKNHLRDKAIIMMFLGTGLRISELVGLDVEDIDLKNRKASVIRKGGNEDTVFFSKQIQKVLKDYLKDSDNPGTRKSYKPAADEHALFLTVRRKRYSVRGVQDMIKENCRELFGEDTKFSPHKLRASYGSAVYRQTGDIKLAAEALNHKSVSTTEKYYVKFDEERKKKAAINIPTLK